MSEKRYRSGVIVQSEVNNKSEFFCYRENYIPLTISTYDGRCLIRCSRTSSFCFIYRVPLKTSWRGLRDKELSEASGIPDCIFVHASGFIGGAKSRESVMEMALQSLKAADRL